MSGAYRDPADHPFEPNEADFIGGQAGAALRCWPDDRRPGALTLEAACFEPLVTFIRPIMRPGRERHGLDALDRESGSTSHDGDLCRAGTPPPLWTMPAFDPERLQRRIDRSQREAISKPRQPRVESLTFVRLDVHRQDGGATNRPAGFDRVKIRSQHGDDRRAA